MKTGLVSVSFRKHTPQDILRACVNAGIRAIEWGSDVHAPPADLEHLRRLAREQEACGVHCSSYGTYFRVGTHRPEDIYPYIRAAEILGTKTLRIWCGSRAYESYDRSGDRSPDRDSAEALEADCRELCRVAEAEQVRLCTEFHHGTYTDCAESVAHLCRLIASPHWCTYWQPNQFKSAAENLASAKAVAPWTANLHVFNWEGNNKYPLIEARALWRDYLSCFSHNSYALLEFMPDGRLETLPQEASALRAILEELP